MRWLTVIGRRHLVTAVCCGLPLAAHAQPPTRASYPNATQRIVLAEGDTVVLLSRMLLDAGPAMRMPGRRLEFHYATRLAPDDSVARLAQADRAAQRFGSEAVEVGVRRMSIGICDTRACAERRAPPAMWFLYERTASGWKRSGS